MTRLETIFSLITRCKVFADIGCDHGYTAKYALNFADLVIATDIGEKCLDKAKKLLQGCDNVKFYVGDGLKPIKEELSLICISGMGGHTITDILCQYDGDADLILQPQNDVYFVREFLMNSGYTLTHDMTIKENKKYYDVLKAVRGKESLDKTQLCFGKFYMDKEPLFMCRLTHDYKRIKGYKQTEENKKKLRQIEEILFL